jgi:tetratricopeptide (TPR) repeat protein
MQVTSLLLLVTVAYWNSLDGGFHFDDQGIFLDPYVMGSGLGWKIFRLIQTRPLTYLSFHWNYLAGGSAPLGFHLINVLLHATNAVCVMLVARRTESGSGSLPFLAGALFAVHPLQTQAVNYVFERATLLATLFALLSLLLFMKELYFWSAAAFGLSLLSKEETIALPAFLLLYEFMRGRLRAGWSYYLATLGLAALFTARLFYALHVIPDAQLGFNTKGISTLSYALTQCRIVWIYLRLFLVPLGLNLQHDVSLSQGLLSPPTTLPALLALALLIGTLTWLAWRKNEPALWALGFFVLLAPSSSLIPAADLMFEHRTYFPLACLTLAAAFLFKRLRPPLQAPILTALIAALLVGTIARNRVWHDEYSLWADVMEKSPHKALGYFQLAAAYASQDPPRARQLYERGLEIEPGNPSGHTNLALLFLSAGDSEAALIHLRRALALGGNTPLIWNNIGSAQLRRGEVEEGIQSFRRALAGDPCRFDARVNLTRALAYTGAREDALTAATIPADCHWLPAQIKKLKDERSSVR